MASSIATSFNGDSVDTAGNSTEPGQSTLPPGSSSQSEAATKTETTMEQRLGLTRSSSFVLKEYQTIETSENYALFVKVQSSPTKALFILTSYPRSRPNEQWLGRLVRSDTAGWGVDSWNSVPGESVAEAIQEQGEGSVKSHDFVDGGSYDIHVHLVQPERMKARDSFTFLEEVYGTQ
jgi:hypothetical protein